MNSATNSKMTTAWSSDGKRVVPLEGPLKARSLVDNQPDTSEEEKGYRLFLNMLKSMHNIDAYELGDVFSGDEEWGRFRRDPFQWFIDNQGDQARKIYKLVMERQS